MSQSHQHPRPRHLPSAHPPGSVQEKSGVKGGCGASGAKQEPPASSTSRGAQARSSAPAVNRGGDNRSPKIRCLQFLLIHGVFFHPEHPMTVRGAELGGTDPAQPLAATVPWAHTRGDVASSPPRTSAGDPSLGPGLRLPAEPLSERGAARPGGAARQRAGGRGAGPRALPDGEVPHFGGALGGGRGGAFVQVLQRRAPALVGAGAAVLGAVLVVPGGPWGHGVG